MSQFISVFDMLKIGVGPSSSHTLGPWRAAQKWVSKLKNTHLFLLVDTIKIDLYGSLSLTGKGHATDTAILLGLSGADPEYIPIEDIDEIINSIQETSLLYLNNEKMISFSVDNIKFNKDFL
jgi:L-serine dehydratase